MANNLQIVKNLLATNQVQKRFREILGQKAPQFMASITNAVSSNSYLQQCDANSVMAAALVAATYDLPIDNNLGFAAIVPYGNRAQYQIMYRGLVQLAIRSGYYEKMNDAEVYQDELVSYNPITGEVTFVDDFSKCTQRAEGKTDQIIGYYAWFRLKTGFTKELYMSKSDIENHARKYSQSYQYDIKRGKRASRWSIDFPAMAKKTVLKQLLSKWGILSVDMQRAIQDDQKVFQSDGTATYADNQSQEIKQETVVDVFAQQAEKETSTESVLASPQKAKAVQEDQQQELEFAAFDAQFTASDDDLPWN